MQGSPPIIDKPSLLICIWIGGLVALITAISLVVDFLVDNDVSLSVSFCATTVILFFGFLFLARGGKEVALISGTGMRTAIAGTVVIEYLLLVGSVAYFEPRDSKEVLPESSRLCFDTMH